MSLVGLRLAGPVLLCLFAVALGLSGTTAAVIIGCEFRYCSFSVPVLPYPQFQTVRNQARRIKSILTAWKLPQGCPVTFDSSGLEHFLDSSGLERSTLTVWNCLPRSIPQTS